MANAASAKGLMSIVGQVCVLERVWSAAEREIYPLGWWAAACCRAGLQHLPFRIFRGRQSKGTRILLIESVV